MNLITTILYDFLLNYLETGFIHYAHTPLRTVSYRQHAGDSLIVATKVADSSKGWGNNCCGGLR